jgi:hypothetical protein
LWSHSTIGAGRVHGFLEGPLNLHVIDYQPSLFGVTLFHLNGTRSKHALVQHGHFQLHANLLVRFIDPADVENHRVAQGFCHAWLMFLGVLPDYHNDLDITNAVSTFGHYHFWNSLDPIKSRILVLFPSHLWLWFLEMLCLRNLAELVAFANLGLLRFISCQRILQSSSLVMKIR